jgi:putative spermidine/putrescine transport system permease protein
MTIASNPPLQGLRRDRQVARTMHRQDRIALLVAPALFLVVALFLCPFLFGLVLSFSTHRGAGFENYVKFFSTAFQRETIWTTLWL